ncbi:E3 ubiquitin-protein ligase TRIM62 [Aplochiton taeniatus]
MAQEGPLLVGQGPAAQSDVGAPSVGGLVVLQDSGPSPTLLDPTGDGVSQPYPRSPKLLRKMAEAGKLTQKQLSRRLEELQAERTRATAHIQSLKKRRTDLTRSAEVVKQKVQERFQAMRTVLQADEEAVLDSLDVELRETSTKLNQVLKDWDQHLGHVHRAIQATQKVLEQSGGAEGDLQVGFKHWPGVSLKNSEHPLQFDKVCCALGSVAVTTGQSYWEADMRCCTAWAVGVAYGSLKRKGRDKGSKLGRNRNSWCVELWEGRLSAWHNDKYMPCNAPGRAPPGKVGVWVNYEKGQLTFYDAETMRVLQEFSAAVMPVFDRVHHQFTEPLYHAVRLLRPPASQAWPNHMEICHLKPL